MAWGVEGAGVDFFLVSNLFVNVRIVRLWAYVQITQFPCLNIQQQGFLVQNPLDKLVISLYEDLISSFFDLPPSQQSNALLHPNSSSDSML